MAIIQSPLARSLQGGLIQSRVSGGVFGGGGFTGSGASGVDEDGNKKLLEDNQSTLADIASGINGIRIQISSLNESLNSIATRITNDSTLESTMAQADQDYQRKLSERQVRIGQESALESKIQTALTKPVVALQNKVSSVFGNVGNALRTLFLGWLLNQGIEALKANAEENKEKLISIRNEVLKAFAFVIAGGGILAIIKAAIVGLTRSVIGLAARIGGFVVKGLFLRPFQLVIDALKGMMNKVTGAAAEGAVKGAGEGAVKGAGEGALKGAKPKGMSGFGAITNLAFGGFDFLQRKGEGQTNLQAGAGAASSVAGAEAGVKLGSKLPGWLKIPGMIVGGGLGWMGGGGLSDVFTGANKSNENGAPVAKAQPMQTSMGATAAQPAAAPSYNTPAALRSEEINIMPMGLTPSPKTTDEKTQAKPKGKETTKPAATTTTTKNVTPAAMMAPAETKPAETKPAEITAAETKSVPKEMPNVGPAAKPKPNVVIAAAPSQNQSSVPPKSSAPATQVPNIPSSNPDNFYALYSQLNYNVVM